MPQKTQPAQAAIPFRKSILGRTFMSTILITTVAAILLSLCANLLVRSLLVQRVFLQLSSAATAKEQIIESRLQSDRERTALLGAGSQTQSILKGGDTARLATLLASLQEEGIPALGISVANAYGVVIAHTGLPTQPVPAGLDATTLIPIQGDEGWEGHTVFAPLRNGTLIVRYSAQELLDTVLNASSVGDSGEVLLGMAHNGHVVLLNNSFAPDGRSPLDLGQLSGQEQGDLDMATALKEKNGYGEFQDYRGNSVFTAYRFLPSLGWELAVKVEVAEMLQGARVLSSVLTIISCLLIVLSAVIAFRFAKQLTEPLQLLSKRVSHLGPGKWRFSRSVQTGDEVEVLDSVVTDMAARLKKTYEHMEEEIEDRTEELKRQYLKDRTILESIDHGVILVDARGTITDANPAALAFLHCESEQCKGENVEETLNIYRHSKRLKGGEHPVTKCLREGRLVRSTPDIHYSVMRPDEIRMPILIVAKPFTKGKKLIGAVVVFQDETDARRVDYLKSEFIALASHQLRTPLASLQWYIELFKDEENLSSAQKDYLKEMIRASDRMVKLIDSLLHAARLEGGNLIPHTQNIDIIALIAGLAEECRSLAKSNKIGCTVELPKEQMFIETDSVLLHIVFKNLFSNAVKYTKEKGTVGVSMKSSGKWVEIRVKDTGVGIPKEEQKRIFQRLFRASNVRKMDTDGNGLGLYISKVIVENLGGSITFESKEKKGTTFIVKLPLKMKKSHTKKSH